MKKKRKLKNCQYLREEGRRQYGATKAHQKDSPNIDSEPKWKEENEANDTAN